MGSATYPLGRCQCLARTCKDELTSPYNISIVGTACSSLYYVTMSRFTGLAGALPHASVISSQNYPNIPLQPALRVCLRWRPLVLLRIVLKFKI